MQTAWVNALSVELGEIASVDPRFPGSQTHSEKKMIFSKKENKWVNLQDTFRGQNSRSEPPVLVPPDSLPAFQAKMWPDNHLGVVRGKLNWDVW